ncbi:hypothetical protein ACFVT9_29035 [Kitasatospora cineracea]|uniref:hypothetical protein n=1 Tax=Kitasatospora cineracea TaxID=88074 RepID=UPI0036DA32D3
MPIALSVLLTLTLSGCFMSDPEPLLFGVRVTGGKVEVKLPVCKDEQIVEITAYLPEPPQDVLFEAAGPAGTASSDGSFTLWQDGAWKADGFPSRKVDQTRTELPDVLDVGYLDSKGGKAGDALNLKAAAAAAPPDGSYWTRRGIRTAKAIDDQLKCSSPNAG